MAATFGAGTSLKIHAKLHFYAAAILAALLLGGCETDREQTPTGLAAKVQARPDYNVLVVSFDALRADALGTHGYPRDTSPNIDAFADRSIVFESAYSAAPVTPTSFAAAFTGQYPFRVFVGWQLRDSLTLASLMRNSGYATFGIFNNVQLARQRNFDQGFEVFSARSTRDERIFGEARDLLEAHADQKFFGWIHFLSPHTPYEYREMSDHLAPFQEEGRFAKSTGGHYEVHNDAELKRARDLYDGEVYYADDLFRRLMNVLEELGLQENTIIALTADHGEEFMDHGQLQHNSMFEEVVRIPMMIYHPDLQQGVRTRQPFVNIDLLPTLAALAGIEPPAVLDGIDQINAADSERFRVVTGMTNKDRYEIMIEQSGRKLIQLCTPDFKESLFDLNTDPGEKTDVVLDRPDVAGELFEELQSIVMGEPCRVIADSSIGKTPEQLLNDEQIEQLKSLGYIQ